MRFKDKLRKKIFLISTISLLVIGLALVIIGYACIGADIVGWLTSTYAIWCYVGIGLFLVIFLIVEMKDKIGKM